MGTTADLTLAKKRKKDEFYTQLVDIENELKHYKEHFKDKVVLCNCDDPRKSNFFKYFADNFATRARMLISFRRAIASGQSARFTKATRTAIWLLMMTRSALRN